MNHPVLVCLFLGAGVLCAALGCLGLWLMRGAGARLHFCSFTGLLAPPLVMAAVLSTEGLSQAGLKAILVVVLLWAQSPVLAHAIGRAIYAHDRVRPSERKPSEHV